MNSSELLRATIKDLRRVGIPARASRKDGAVLFLPTLGPDAVIALRLLHPALQKLRIQTGLQGPPIENAYRKIVR